MVKRTATALLWGVLILSGIVLAARTALGPFQFQISVGSPLNAESIFGVALILILAMRAIPAPRKESGSFDRGDALVCAGIAALTALVFSRSASWSFLSDDFILIKYALQPAHHLKTTFTTGGGDGFFRPLVYASFAWPRIGTHPVIWHAIGIALHCANSLLVFLLGSRLRFSRFAAGTAAALFAVHATRPEVVIWVTGRFDLLATFFVLLTLVCFLRGGWWKAIALAAMILGLISKESAYAAPVALFGIMIVTGAWRSRRAVSYAPFFAAAIAVFAYRWSLLHGIGGYLTPSGTPQAMSLNLISVSKALLYRVWAILFFPINWTIQPGAVLAIAMFLYLGALAILASARPNRRSLLIGLALSGVFLLPVIPVMLIGADLEKARYLYLPSVGFCLLIASAIEAARWRWAVGAAVVIFQVVALAHNLIPWESAAEMSQNACELLGRDTAPGLVAVLGVPGYLDGVQVFANGLKECVDLQNPHHAELTVILNETTIPDPSRFDRIYVWDEQSRTLKSREKHID